MIGAGIDDGDILVIDRSIKLQNNTITVCYFDGEFTIKRIKVEKDGVYLMPENAAFQTMKVTDENDLIICGLVTYVVKSM